MSTNPVSTVTSIVVGLLLLAFSPFTFAQELKTVGDLLDRGGVQVTKDELVKLLSGAVNSGVQHGTNATFRNAMNEDGSLKGTAVLANGQTVAVYGTWTVGQDGELLSELKNDRGARWESTIFYFKLGNRYFGAKSKDKTAQLEDRQIERK